MITLETDGQLKELINEKKTVLLFSAQWCPDCRVIEPILPEVEGKFSDWTFVYVDRDQFIHICAENDIFGIPSFLAFDEGEEVGRFVSKEAKTQKEIEDFMNSINL
ncbi:thioredoxin family protein [Halobacillus campisalis]|uniref:Thioredoxin family protein n=1 Tax=Halobacillus campisalis TaxID=435909 RepID=A0ABW2K2E3_9BACI|nr:thioredoxin family protein [Halobacillus campisalis]